MPAWQTLKCLWWYKTQPCWIHQSVCGVPLRITKPNISCRWIFIFVECHWDKISAQIWFNPNESKPKRVELKLDKLKLMLRIWPQSGSVTKRLIIVGVCFYKCATAAFWPQVYILPGCKLVSHFSHKSKAKTCCKLVPIFTGLLFYKLVSIFIWFSDLFCYCCMSVVSVFGVSPRFGLCSCDGSVITSRCWYEWPLWSFWVSRHGWYYL